MKAYRTTKEFARAMCRENGRARPKETYYIVEDWQHAVRTERKAPNSYHGLKRVLFFADGRYVTRRFGLWVESGQRLGRDLAHAAAALRGGREAAGQGPAVLPASLPQRRAGGRGEAEPLPLRREVETVRGVQRKVIEETKGLMEEEGCFGTLRYRGNLLAQPAA